MPADDQRAAPRLRRSSYDGTRSTRQATLQPSLVAEVVSGQRQERDYQSRNAKNTWIFGIREYWIVDPILRQLTLLIRQGEGANATWDERIFKDADPIESPHLPGLAVTVAELWAGI